MRTRVRPMRPQDVGPCVALVASHPEECRRYGTALEQLRPAWLKLLRAGSIETTLIEDIEDHDGRPQLVGCGTSVFVSDQLLAHLKTAPLAWLGPELVRRALLDDGSILTPKAIRKANSGEGLNLVAWAGIVCAPRPEEDDTLGLELIRSFFSQHAGYRAKELITQPSECEWSRRTLNTGAFLWQAAESCYHDARSQPFEKLFEKPFLLGATRELASGKGAVLGTWLSSLFCYEPPRIYFRPAEQRLLEAALRGLTDEQLGDELGISLSAVKKTWRSAYNRASQASLPELALSATGGAETKRGREKKQPLLEYLRRHIEELRPALPQGTR